jgi:putative ABC transport system permease protein
MIDTLLMSLRSLRAHKLRSALTLSGIVIGITAVVGMSALIRGVDEVIVGSIRAMNPHVVYLTKTGIVLSHEQWLKVVRRPDITLDDADAIEAGCPSVGRLDVFAEGNGALARGATRTRDIAVFGVGMNYLEVNSMTLRAGRFFTPGEVAAAARVMVLAKEPAEALFGLVDPVGKTVRLGAQEYEVVGIFAPQADLGGFNLGQDNFCVLPHTAHHRDVGRGRRSLTLAVIPREGVAVEAMIEEITTFMRVRHRLRADQDDDFELLTQASVLKLWRDMSSATFLALLGISSIALVVSGIGVTAVMTVAVSERTREIGIRRAVGASRQAILSQFLCEAAILTAIGGAIGSGLGAAAAWGLAKALTLPVATPWDTFAMAIGMSTMVGLVFGVMPAWRAARLDPVEALRYE